MGIGGGREGEDGGGGMDAEIGVMSAKLLRMFVMNEYHSILVAC